MAALGRTFERGLAFAVAFIWSGLALIAALALIETLTPLHVPLGPGRTILAWAIACAALAMGARAARRVGRRGVVTARAIEAARWRPILFREMFPPPAEPGLSFYGGAPVGPTEMSWPREEDGTPLTFVMQWECAALTRLDPTGLLPKSGVLYLFSNLRWGDAMHFRFLHQPGDGAEGWGPLTVPADLPPAFGAEASYSSTMVSAEIPVERRDAPQLLPRWPFAPVIVDYPDVELKEEKQLFWANKLAAEVLVHAQDTTGALVPKPGTRWLEGRPFPGFPHDWASVRVVATEALKSLDRIADYKWKRIAPGTDVTTRKALMDGWRAEARTLYEEAISHQAGQAIPRDEADRLWQRIEPLAQVVTLWAGTVWTSINISLGLRSDGLSVVPAGEIEACASGHRLGTAYLRQEYEYEFQARSSLDGPIQAAKAKWLRSKDPADMAAADALSKEAFAQFNLAKEAGMLEHHRDVFAPTPNRMFGPPSYVQGYVEEYLGEWLLLLELVSQDSIGFRLGEGVIQFMIRPHDLAAGSFDRVKVVASAY